MTENGISQQPHNKKGSVLIIALWILALLVIFAVGLGHRAAINLKLSGYQKDRLKSNYLARGGLALAILELKNDSTTDFDSLNEAWSTGLDINNNNIFKKIIINDKYPKDIVTVASLDDESANKFICLTDEERKINLNKISDANTEKQVEQIFLKTGLESADIGAIIAIIKKWAGVKPVDAADPDKDIFKKARLKVPEELLFILEYFYTQKDGSDKARDKAQGLYLKVKDYFTVYGSTGKININTASQEVLNAVVVATDPLAQGLTDKIINYRDNTAPFKSDADVDAFITTTGLSGNEQTAMNSMKANSIAYKSNNFKIESVGDTGKVSKRIIAIFDRSNKEIVKWHEK